jgi:hypothetical protein
MVEEGVVGQTGGGERGEGCEGSTRRREWGNEDEERVSARAGRCTGQSTNRRSFL